MLQKVPAATNGNTGTKPARNPEREKPKWEDTITNRMLHWSYTPEQKEEVKKALSCRSSESNDSYLLLSGGYCGEDEFISEEAVMFLDILQSI